MSEVIDFHTHNFPDVLAPRAIESMAEKLEGRLVPFGDGTVATQLRDMAAAGVDKAVVCPVATKPAQFQAILDRAKAVRDGEFGEGHELKARHGLQQGGDLRGAAHHGGFHESKVDSAVRYHEKPGVAYRPEVRDDLRVAKAEPLIVRMHLHALEADGGNLPYVPFEVRIRRMHGTELHKAICRLFAEFAVPPEPILTLT